MARFKPQEATQRATDGPSQRPTLDFPTAAAVAIDLPIGDPMNGHQPHHISVQLFTPAARAGAARLLDGLRRAGAVRRDTERAIDSMADAVRYLLEEYEQAASAAE